MMNIRPTPSAMSVQLRRYDNKEIQQANRPKCCHTWAGRGGGVAGQGAANHAIIMTILVVGLNQGSSSVENFV